MIAYIVNHRKTPNIIVTIIDTFSADNSCMSIIGNLRYNVNASFLGKIHVVAIYPPAINIDLKCCGRCGNCKGENCNNAKKLFLVLGLDNESCT